MHLKTSLVVILFLAINNNGVAQQSKPFAQNNKWLDLGFGFNYTNSTLTRFDNDIPVTGEDLSGFGILLNPKYQLFVKDNYCVGFHIGFEFDSFKNNGINYKISRYDYSVGVQNEYFFNVFKNVFFISGEVILGLHYINSDITLDNSELNGFDDPYFKGGFNINISYQLNQEFNFYIKFNDWITYLTTNENFYDFDKGLNLNNALENLINFPQFGFRYRIF